MINEGGIAKVEEHIADALKRGATLVTGGKRLSGSSFILMKYTWRQRATAIFKLNQKLLSGFTRYLEPTVLTNVPRDSLALTDETFGPRESYFHRDSYI